MSEAASHLRRALCAAALAPFVWSCAQKGTTVVLLPEEGGARTAVSVKQDGKEVVLDKPYAAVKPSLQGPEPYTSSQQEVQAKFGPVLAALPSRPASFTLYFVEGKDEFSDVSKPLVDGIFAEIAKRPVPDVVVIGHTDTVGTDQVNDALSLKRAETVRAELIRRGVAPENVKAVGRGKRDLLVPTADNVAEPRNRRVEILVR